MKNEAELLRPILLKSTYFDGYQKQFNRKMAYRTVYDYEIEYYTQSEGGIEVDGTYIRYQKGDICIRKPGEYVCGISPYSCICLCLDLYGNAEKREEYDWGSSQVEPPFFPLLEAMPNKILAQDGERIGRRLNEIFKLSQRGQHILSDQIKMQEFLFALLQELAIYLENTLQKKVLPHKKVVAAVQYIQEKYCENIEIGSIITSSGLSRVYFHKSFKDYTQTTPNQMILALRMEKAKNLLHFTCSAIGDVALECGYEDNVYFSSLFKRETGMTPSEYRKKMQG